MESKTASKNFKFTLVCVRESGGSRIARVLYNGLPYAIDIPAGITETAEIVRFCADWIIGARNGVTEIDKSYTVQAETVAVDGMWGPVEMWQVTNISPDP